MKNQLLNELCSVFVVALYAFLAAFIPSMVSVWVTHIFRGVFPNFPLVFVFTVFVMVFLVSTLALFLVWKRVYG